MGAVYLGELRGHGGLPQQILRERAGEKLLPWTKGEAAEGARERQLTRWWPLVRNVFAAMAKPASLMLGAGILIAFAAYGLKTAFSPTLAVQEIGWARKDFVCLPAKHLLGT